MTLTLLSRTQAVALLLSLFLIAWPTSGLPGVSKSSREAQPLTLLPHALTKSLGAPGPVSADLPRETESDSSTVRPPLRFAEGVSRVLGDEEPVAEEELGRMDDSPLSLAQLHDAAGEEAENVDNDEVAAAEEEDDELKLLKGFGQRAKDAPLFERDSEISKNKLLTNHPPGRDFRVIYAWLMAACAVFTLLSLIVAKIRGGEAAKASVASLTLRFDSKSRKGSPLSAWLLPHPFSDPNSLKYSIWFIAARCYTSFSLAIMVVCLVVKLLNLVLDFQMTYYRNIDFVSFVFITSAYVAFPISVGIAYELLVDCIYVFPKFRSTLAHCLGHGLAHLVREKAAELDHEDQSMFNEGLLMKPTGDEPMTQLNIVNVGGVILVVLAPFIPAFRLLTGIAEPNAQTSKDFRSFFSFIIIGQVGVCMMFALFMHVLQILVWIGIVVVRVRSAQRGAKLIQKAVKVLPTSLLFGLINLALGEFFCNDLESYSVNITDDVVHNFAFPFVSSFFILNLTELHLVSRPKVVRRFFIFIIFWLNLVLWLVSRSSKSSGRGFSDDLCMNTENKWKGREYGFDEIMAQQPVEPRLATCGWSFGGVHVEDAMMLAILAYAKYPDPTNQKALRQWLPEDQQWEWVESSDKQNIFKFEEFYSPSQNLTVIGVRGTSTPIEILMDVKLYTSAVLFQLTQSLVPGLSLAISPSTLSLLVAATSLGSGAQRIRRSITDLVDEVENRRHPDSDLLFVGHSLGGAIATFAAARLRARVVTFEAPGTYMASHMLWALKNDYSGEMEGVVWTHQGSLHVLAIDDLVPKVDLQTGASQKIFDITWREAHDAIYGIIHMITSCQDLPRRANYSWCGE